MKRLPFGILLLAAVAGVVGCQDRVAPVRPKARQADPAASAAPIEQAEPATAAAPPTARQTPAVERQTPAVEPPASAVEIAAAARVAAADPAAFALRLVEEMEAPARAEESSEFREPILLFIARSYFALGRGDAAREILEEVQAAAEREPDPGWRSRRLGNLAVHWAVVDPPRARRVLEPIQADVDGNADHAWSTVEHLSTAYFELGEYRRGVDVLLKWKHAGGITPMEYFGQAGRHLIRAKQEKLLAEIQAKIREIPSRPDKVDMERPIDVELEVFRIDALANCNLPEDAAALYRRCSPALEEPFYRAEALADVVRAYAQTGRAEEGRKFLRANVTELPAEERYRSAYAAAECGDFALADELLTDTKDFSVLVKSRPVILLAHRAGKTEVRDRLFVRWRETLLDALEKPNPEWRADRVQIYRVIAEMEAGIGRYESAIQVLPEQEGAYRLAMREAIVAVILREQRKRFGYYPYKPMAWFLQIWYFDYPDRTQAPD